MGYTHYWTFNRDKTSSDIEKRYRRALDQIYKVVLGYNAYCKLQDFKHPNRLSGHTPHAPTGKYKDITFNGTGDLGHETFYLAESYLENKGGDFCKTACKPYDIVVTASLIVLKFYLGAEVEIDSDGTAEDWLDGLYLAESILKISGLEVPRSIREAA